MLAQARLERTKLSTIHRASVRPWSFIANHLFSRYFLDEALDWGCPSYTILSATVDLNKN
jgi:hypothetical protein